MTNRDGFFSRIIRDALSSLPNATGEYHVLPVEQELTMLTERSTAAAPQSDSHRSAQTVDTKVSTGVAQKTQKNSALPPSPASAADGHRTNIGKSLSDINQHSGAPGEIATAQIANSIAADFPHDQRLLTPQPSSQQSSQQHSQKLSPPGAPQAAGKKMPLAITLRAAPNSQPLAPLAISVESAQPSASSQVNSSAGKTESGTLSANKTATSVAANTLELANPTSQRQKAAPVVAESAPVLAEHSPAERKIPPPTLRIGAVTIRVVEPVSPAAVVSRVNRPASHTQPAATDPIASAESRHFLRTL